jgi:hypothetical protein
MLEKAPKDFKAQAAQKIKTGFDELNRALKGMFTSHLLY